VSISASRIKVDRSPVFGQCDAARVDDELRVRRISVNNGGEHRERRVLEAAASQSCLISVKEDVISRPDFVDAFEMVDVVYGRCRTNADGRNVYAQVS